MKKYLFIGGAILAVIAVFAYLNTPVKDALGLASTSFRSYATDVVGTKTGTTTVGVNFAVNAKVAGQSASTTYPIKVEGASQALFTFNFKEASSTANLQVSVLTSNDDFCTTATTTSGSGYDVVTTGQINWFDAAPFFDEHAAQSFAIGTSTIALVNPVAGTGKTLLLTNLASQCLALQVSGSSTVAHIQIKTK